MPFDIMKLNNYGNVMQLNENLFNKYIIVGLN